MEARDRAEGLIGYFDFISPCESDEKWKKGLTTARACLRLIDAQNVTPQEISTLVGVVHANRGRGSGWWELAGRVHDWARSKDHPVPPLEEFLSSNLPHFRDVTAEEYARLLIKHFEQ